MCTYSNICLTNENGTLTFSWLLKRMTNRILRNFSKYCSHWKVTWTHRPSRKYLHNSSHYLGPTPYLLFVVANRLMVLVQNFFLMHCWLKIDRTSLCFHLSEYHAKKWMKNASFRSSFKVYPPLALLCKYTYLSITSNVLRISWVDTR